MEEKREHRECRHRCGRGGDGLFSGVYGMAFLGALVYYLENAEGFKAVVYGIFKAVFWPAFLMYRVLQNLGM